MSASSLNTVFLATLVIRRVVRILLPSTKADNTRIRFSLFSLFMLTHILDCPGNAGLNLARRLNLACTLDDTEYADRLMLAA